MEKETLLRFGLSPREVEVYYLLLQVEEALASEISKRTKESRTNTYDIINSLVKKGLIGYVVKNNKKYFIASDPKKLLEWIDLKQEELNNEKQFAEKIISDLVKLKKPSQKKINVEVLEGIGGLRTALRHTIDAVKNTKEKEILMLSALAGILRKLDPIYHERYYKEKKELKIKTRYLFTESSEFPKSPNAEYRFLPHSYKSVVATSIHGDSVIFWLLTDPAICMIVKSKEFAESYKSNFEQLWKIAKK